MWALWLEYCLWLPRMLLAWSERVVRLIFHVLQNGGIFEFTQFWRIWNLKLLMMSRCFMWLIAIVVYLWCFLFARSQTFALNCDFAKIDKILMFCQFWESEILKVAADFLVLIVTTCISLCQCYLLFDQNHWYELSLNFDKIDQVSNLSILSILSSLLMFLFRYTFGMIIGIHCELWFHWTSLVLGYWFVLTLNN